MDTREYKLPPEMVGVPVAIIRCNSTKEKELKTRVPKTIVGTIRFSESFRYKTKQAFEEDFEKHRVAVDHPNYGWNSRPKYGWSIEEVHAFEKPLRVPKMRHYEKAFYSIFK